MDKSRIRHLPILGHKTIIRSVEERVLDRPLAEGQLLRGFPFGQHMTWEPTPDEAFCMMIACLVPWKKEGSTYFYQLNYPQGVMHFEVTCEGDLEEFVQGWQWRKITKIKVF